MAGLTAKNKQAIDVYLGGGSKEAKGSGTKSWQEVYGTKNAETARANWARMLANASARQYLENREAEVQEAVKEKIAYGVADAVRDLMAIQKDAMTEVEKEHDAGVVFNYGMRDRRAAVQATVEALKVQGLYITKSEGVQTQVSPEDRQYAALYGLGVTEYLERKAAGTLPPKPDIPDPKSYRH